MADVEDRSVTLRRTALQLVNVVEEQLGCLKALPAGRRRQMTMFISGLEGRDERVEFARELKRARPLWDVFADYDAEEFNLTVEADSFRVADVPDVSGRLAKLIGGAR